MSSESVMKADQSYPLTDLSIGETARVKELRLTGNIRRRLLDIGLVEGTAVSCLYKSPAGDPTAYLIRGGVIALRTEDAVGVWVQ